MEIYKEKNDEIEKLKREKENIYQNFKQANKDAENNQKILSDYLEKLKNKQFEFQNFMQERGKKAFEYFRNQNELKKAKEKETKKLELKYKVKQNEIEKSRKQVENYREIKNRVKQKEEEDFRNYENPNVIQKIYNCFHNLGNKIDYSTTRFHNVYVVKHDEEELNDFITAQEKAIQEKVKIENTKKMKKKSMEKFVDKTKQNYKEIIKQEKIKRNVKRLQEELDKMKDFKIRNKSYTNAM